MSTLRYHVVKARVKPRIYVQSLEVVDGLTAGASGYRATRWTDEADKARKFTLNVAVAVARRNKHCITVVAQ